jgi:putative alpha-1,2-mannosidase
MYIFDGGNSDGGLMSWPVDGVLCTGRWFVPHDASGLIALFGGEHNFNVQLEQFFEYSKLDPYNILPSSSYSS